MHFLLISACKLILCNDGRVGLALLRLCEDSILDLEVGHHAAVKDDGEYIPVRPNIGCYDQQQSSPSVCAGGKRKHTVDPCVVVGHMPHLNPVVVEQEGKIQPCLQTAHFQKPFSVLTAYLNKNPHVAEL